MLYWSHVTDTKRNVWRPARTHAGLSFSRSHLNNPLVNLNQLIMGFSNSIFTMSSLMFVAVASVALTIFPSLSLTTGRLLTWELFGVLKIKLTDIWTGSTPWVYSKAIVLSLWRSVQVLSHILKLGDFLCGRVFEGITHLNTPILPVDLGLIFGGTYSTTNTIFSYEKPCYKSISMTMRHKFSFRLDIRTYINCR